MFAGWRGLCGRSFAEVGRDSQDSLPVLVLTPDFPPSHGGIQLLLERVIRHAARLRARVVTMNSPGSADFDARQAYSVRRVDWLPASRRLSFLWLNVVALIDSGRARPGAVLSGHIVTGLAAWSISRLRRIPSVQYLHADEVRAAPRLARFALCSAAAVVVVSEHTEQLALSAGVEADRIHRIPPGVDLVKDADANRDGPPTLLTVARLEDEYKGHDVVLRALKVVRERVPDVTWVLVGEGPLRPRLERLAVDYGVEGQVRFLGELSDRERDRWYRDAHVFVMPSRLPAGGGGEGFGIVYMEAAAHALPVVAGDVAGARDAVVHGETGLLVDPMDHLAVANATARLLLDPDERTRLGRQGAERAADFAWPKIARRVEDLVLELAGHDPTGRVS
jgi:phosphatidylinositol alpha-1,6-mannosyltransferase